jgi:RNA polymerase sigma-70 factor (ECF subfamily)
MSSATNADVLPAATGDAELRALLRRVVDRDHEAFRRLYHALRPALVRHLYRRLRRSDAVDEVLNDVMWVVWQNAAAFRGDAQVSTWVLGIATLKSHRARAHLERQLRRADCDLMEQAEPEVPLGFDRDLAGGLARLSDEHRDALELSYYFGYSCAEIAQLRGCPVGTVKTRLFHARRRLREFLDVRVDFCEAT